MVLILALVVGGALSRPAQAQATKRAGAYWAGLNRDQKTDLVLGIFDGFNLSESILGITLKNEYTICSDIMRAVHGRFPAKVDSLSRAVLVVGGRQLSTLALGVSVLPLFQDIPQGWVNMMRYCIPGLAVLIVLLTAGVVCCAPYGPRSGAGAVRTYDAVPRQPLTVGKSIRIESSENITRVSVGAKEVADFVLLSPREVYVTGIAPGLTNLMQEIFAFEQRGVTPDGKVKGVFLPRGIRPKFAAKFEAKGIRLSDGLFDPRNVAEV